MRTVIKTALPDDDQIFSILLKILKRLDCFNKNVADQKLSTKITGTHLKNSKLRPKSDDIILVSLRYLKRAL